MRAPSDDLWDVLATARTIRRFTDEPVDDLTLSRCLQAAAWAPSGANAQGWRFIVLRSPEQRAVVAEAAAPAVPTKNSARCAAETSGLDGMWRGIARAGAHRSGHANCGRGS